MMDNVMAEINTRIFISRSSRATVMQLLTQAVHDRVRSCCPWSGMCYMGNLAVTEAQQVCRTTEIKQCLIGLRAIVLLCEYPHSG